MNRSKVVRIASVLVILLSIWWMYGLYKAGGPFYTPDSNIPVVPIRVEPEPNFEGEADPNKMTLGMKTWVWEVAVPNDGEVYPKNPGKFTLTFGSDGRFSFTTDCNSGNGKYGVKDKIPFFTEIIQTLMYCENSQEAYFLQLLSDTYSYHFTSKGELILDFLYDSGYVVFR